MDHHTSDTTENIEGVRDPDPDPDDSVPPGTGPDAPAAPRDEAPSREPQDRQRRLTVMSVRGGRFLRWAAGLVAASLVGYLAVVWLRYELGSTSTYEGYDGPVMVSGDGRTVTVGGFPGPCPQGDVSLVADQTPARVALRLQTTVPRRRTFCSADMAIIWALSVRLTAPLGLRLLLDPDTGRTLPWFDGSKILQPTKLPAGYARTITSPVPFLHLPVDRVTDPTGCTQVFANAIGSITITQRMAVVQPPSVPTGTTTAILVRGRQGRADTTSITWSEDGQTITATAQPEGMLTVQGLIAIMESAP